MALSPTSSRGTGLPTGWTQDATTGQVVALATTAAGTPLIVRGRTGQGISDGAQLLLVENVDGDDIVYADSGGSVQLGTVNSAAGEIACFLPVRIDTGAVAKIGLLVNAENGQTADLVQILDHTPAILSRFNKAGYFMTRKAAAPADADLATGELAFWFDPANGAAKLMLKGKQADGTVKTGSVNVQT